MSEHVRAMQRIETMAPHIQRSRKAQLREERLTGSRIVVRSKSPKARSLLRLIVLLAEAASSASKERHTG